MVPLALLLMVQQTTGSYAVAGLASATHGIAMAVMSPVLGRLADRRGPRRVLLAQVTAYPLLLTTLVLTVLGGAPAEVIIAAAAAAGASTPLVSGTVRALWSRVDPAHRPTAFALDATCTELVFVAGPTAVATLAVLATPAIAVGVAGVLAVSGALGIATSRVLRGWAPETGPRSGLFSTVLTPGMPRILASGSALMLGFGALETAVPAFADAAGSPGMSGVLLALWSLGSVAGGLWFGARVVSVSLPRQYRWGLLGTTIGLAPLAHRVQPAGARRPAVPGRDGDRADAHRAELAGRLDRPAARHHRGVHLAVDDRVRRLGRGRRDQRCADRELAGAECQPDAGRGGRGGGGPAHAGAGAEGGRGVAVAGARGRPTCAPGAGFMLPDSCRTPGPRAQPRVRWGPPPEAARR